MNAKRILLLGLCLILICSCGTKKKKKGRVAYVDYESEYVLETETIDIPFRVEMESNMCKQRLMASALIWFLTLVAPES